MQPRPWHHAAADTAKRAFSLVFRAPWAVAGVVLATVLLGAACYNQVVVTSLPGPEALRRISSMAQATTLLDVHGQSAFTIFREQRIDVPLERVSPHLVRAIVAIEDQRFYDHRGVDVVRIAGAALSNLRSGSRGQGGSTITQQLARQSFLTAEKTYLRKVRELVLARRIERAFSKDEILELYLNKVYFGAGLYGVEAAALGYFGTPAAKLDLPQAAMLAGLVKSPSTYAPTVDMTRATSRRNIVLGAMHEAGMISPEEHDAAAHAAVTLTDSLRRAEGYGQYFKEAVRLELVERFGQERVYQGGLKVYTTIDLEMQKAAEQEIARSLKEIEARQAARRRKGATAPSEPLQAALVALDPETGEVRALVGGRDFRSSSFDRARQARRQAGSAFKPFVYAAAIEAGYAPGSLLTNLDQPINTPQGAWAPEDEHLETPSMTMRTALRTSSNRAAVHMLDEVGIPAAVTLATAMGVGDVPSVPSLALGAGEVTLLSMTSAYGAFANHGVLQTPVLIRRVEAADGTVLYEHEAAPSQVVSESTAYLMTTMLADVVNSGTAWPARRVGFTRPAAGKTGTTNEYRDAWFVGFTPHLVSGVWLGYDQPRTIVAGGYASELAVPLWGRFMTRATERDASDWYHAPSTIRSASICRLSGKLATHACEGEHAEHGGPNVYTDYFAEEHLPTEYCELHTLRPRKVPGVVAASLSPSVSPNAPVTAQQQTPVAEAAPAAVPAPAATEAPEPQKKRGFWSRVFGKR